jgi:hypothetical protein
MYPYDDDEDLEPVPFIPRKCLSVIDDLEGSGFDGFEPYGRYYDGDFDELIRDNFSSYVNPLDELEDISPDGESLEYRRIPSKRK